MTTMAAADHPGDVIDLITAEDAETLCHTCSDPIGSGEVIAVLSNGAWVHDDSFCRHEPEDTPNTESVRA